MGRVGEIEGLERIRLKFLRILGIWEEVVMFLFIYYLFTGNCGRGVEGRICGGVCFRDLSFG